METKKPGGEAGGDSRVVLLEVTACIGVLFGWFA